MNSRSCAGLRLAKPWLSMLVVGLLLTCSCGDGAPRPDADATTDTRELFDHSDVSEENLVCDPGVNAQTVKELADLLIGPWPNMLGNDGPWFFLTGDINIEQDLVIDSTDIHTPSDCSPDSNDCHVYFWTNPLLAGVETLNQVYDETEFASWTRIRIPTGRYRFFLTHANWHNKKLYFIAVVNDCNQDYCPSPYLACPNRLCFFQNRYDYCTGCLSLRKEQCACQDLSENASCSYFIFEDLQTFSKYVGTCRSGRCI